ncbi:hypothetical protein ES332_D09G035800v1 [Gossypium tomentosum]|uniref:Uncharacterized protein n=1 Tax=Gossypium tomentosum TaxID=34277 RepID=A0A5D2JCA2_GOSTO|nr:hypothetical protein ES332_D09G035800v1 [Gossypium tomentosum]
MKASTVHFGRCMEARAWHICGRGMLVQRRQRLGQEQLHAYRRNTRKEKAWWLRR